MLPTENLDALGRLCCKSGPCLRRLGRRAPCWWPYGCAGHGCGATSDLYNAAGGSFP